MTDSLRLTVYLNPALPRVRLQTLPEFFEAESAPPAAQSPSRERSAPTQSSGSQRQELQGSGSTGTFVPERTQGSAPNGNPTRPLSGSRSDPGEPGSSSAPVSAALVLSERLSSSRSRHLQLEMVVYQHTLDGANTFFYTSFPIPVFLNGQFGYPSALGGNLVNFPVGADLDPLTQAVLHDQLLKNPVQSQAARILGAAPGVTGGAAFLPGTDPKTLALHIFQYPHSFPTLIPATAPRLIPASGHAQSSPQTLPAQSGPVPRAHHAKAIIPKALRPPRPRKPTIRLFTAAQKEVLIGQYEVNPSPSNLEKAYLARKFSVTPEQIGRWFRHKRAEEKKKMSIRTGSKP